jgi:hypothetical protein
MEKNELLLFLFYSLFRVKQSNHMMTLGLIDHGLFKKKRIVFVMTERNLKSGFYMCIAFEEFLYLFRNGKKRGS